MTALMPVAEWGYRGGAGIIAVVAIFVILATVFWIWMLIDCLARPMPSGEKVLWFLVIFFLHLLGAVLYFVIRRGDEPPVVET